MNQIQRLTQSVAAMSAVAEDAITALTDQAQLGPIADQVDQLRGRLADAMAVAAPPDPAPVDPTPKEQPAQ